MPLPSSGQISMSQVYAEFGSYSLHNASVSAGLSTPDSMSELYGKDSRLIMYLNAANSSSYPGSGTTWYDLSGKGNHATLTNRSASNPVWNSTYFTFTPTYAYGTYQYGSYASTVDGTFASIHDYNLVTMSVRFYPIESSYPMILCGNSYNGGTPAYQGFQIYINGTTMYARVTINNTTTYHDISASMTLNAWQHATLVYDGSTMYFYTNGSLVGSYNFGGGSLNWVAPYRFLIGAQYNAQSSGNTAEMYKGNISHVRLYNRALNSTEVYNNYNTDMGF